MNLKQRIFQFISTFLMMRLPHAVIFENQLNRAIFLLIVSKLQSRASITGRKRLDIFQKRFYKLLCGYKFTSNHLSLQPLESRQTDLSMKLLKQIMLSDHILHSLLPTRSVRAERQLLPHVKTSRRLNFVLF